MSLRDIGEVMFTRIILGLMVVALSLPVLAEPIDPFPAQPARPTPKMVPASNGIYISVEVNEEGTIDHMTPQIVRGAMPGTTTHEFSVRKLTSGKTIYVIFVEHGYQGSGNFREVVARGQDGNYDSLDPPVLLRDKGARDCTGGPSCGSSESLIIGFTPEQFGKYLGPDGLVVRLRSTTGDMEIFRVPRADIDAALQVAGVPVP